MTNYKKIGTLVVATYPITSIYSSGIPSISLGELLFIIVSFTMMNKIADVKNWLFSKFLLYSILSSFFVLLIHSEYPFVNFSFEIISLLLIIFILNTAKNVCDYSLLKDYIKNLSVICLAFFFVQYFVFLLSSTVLPGIVPFLPLSNGVETDEFIMGVSGKDRVSSFFQEPAHFSEFMVIPLALNLFSAKKLKDYILSFLFIAAIILSQSATGFSMVMIIVGYKLLLLLKGKKNKFLAAIVSVIVIAVFPVLMNTEMISNILSRYTQISLTPENTSSYGLSSYIRVVRGYIPFTELSPLNQLIGNGFGSLPSFLATHHSNFLSIADKLENYMNSIQIILFSSGIVGLFLFLGQHYNIYKKTTEAGKILIITIIAEMFASGVHFSPSFILSICIAYFEMTHRVGAYVRTCN